MNTLKEARDYLNDNYKKGCVCPVCGGQVREYKRKINSGMCLFLLGLYKLTEGVYYRKDKETSPTVFFTNEEIMKKMNITAKSLDYSVLKHFGLMEPMISFETNKRNSGKWQITLKGIKFIRGFRIPKYAYILNNKLRSFSEEETTFIKSLGNNFDFRELMGNQIWSDEEDK